MSGNERWSTIVEAKLVSDLVTFSIRFSDFLLDLHE